MAAVPSIGRATRVERKTAPGADAAGALYERYSAQIFGYCLHQLGSREEAEDAVQTTFMNAFRGLSRGIVPELESAWLFKIAHNVCLSRRRSSWRRGKIEAPNNFEVLQEVVPGRETIGDELIRLQDVLEDMPESQRRAILLREWQGLTYREISTELGLTQAAVETLIFRARRALAQGLEQDAGTWKRRLRRGADVGGAIACIKALLGGGGAAAVKVAATALAVGTAAVAASTQLTPRQTHHAGPAMQAQARQPSSLTHFEHTALTALRPSKAVATTSTATATIRKPSRPIAAPPVHPATASAAPSAEAEKAPAPAPAGLERQPDAAPSTAQAPPTTPPTTAGPGHGKGKGQAKKIDRTPQATTETTATPSPDSEPLPADPTDAPLPDSAPGQDKKSTQPGSSADGNGKAKGHDK